MVYIVYQEDRPDGAAAIRKAKLDEHLAYLEQHKDILVLGGALLAEDASQRLGSVALINAASRAAVDAFVANEPFRRAGLFKSIKVSRMRKGQWHPDNAPKTPEGN